MYTVSATITLRVRKGDCPYSDSIELDRWVRGVVDEVHKDACAKLHAHGFTIDTEILRILIPGGNDG